MGAGSITCRGWLVQQQHVGLQGDAECDVGPLGLAARELRPGFSDVLWIQPHLVKERDQVSCWAATAGEQGTCSVKEVLGGALEGDTGLMDVGDGCTPVGGAELLGSGVVEGDRAALVDAM